MPLQAGPLASFVFPMDEPDKHGTIDVDVDSFPIVMVTQWGAVSDEVYAAHLEEMGRLEERIRVLDRRDFGDKMVMVYDASHASPPTARQRKMQAEFIAANEDRIQGATLGFAFVAPSVGLRGVIQAIFWLQPPLYDYRICSNLLEAYNWADDKLEEYKHARGAA